MSIKITQAAADHIARCLKDRGTGQGLRVGVKPSGCSGLSYVLDFADEIKPDDHVFEQHGVKLIVAEANLQYLDGAEVDFVKEGLNQFFRFNNPNVKDECGCGESFTI